MGIAKTHNQFNSNLAGEMYQQGKTDAEIAESCGVTRDTVKNWRKRSGLTANYEKKRKLSQLEKDAIAARKAGLTYGQYKAKFFRN